jgi:hypothetical protein
LVTSFVQPGTTTTGEIAKGTTTTSFVQPGTTTTGEIGKGTTTTSFVQPGTTTTGEIAKGTTTTSFVQPGTTTTGEIAKGTTTTSFVQPGTTTTGEIGKGTTTTSFVQPGTTTTGEIGKGTTTTSFVQPGTTTTGEIGKGTTTTSFVQPGTSTTGVIGKGTTTTSFVQPGTTTTAFCEYEDGMLGGDVFISDSSIKIKYKRGYLENVGDIRSSSKGLRISGTGSVIITIDLSSGERLAPLVRHLMVFGEFEEYLVSVKYFGEEFRTPLERIFAVGEKVELNDRAISQVELIVRDQRPDQKEMIVQVKIIGCFSGKFFYYLFVVVSCFSFSLLRIFDFPIFFCMC